MIASDFKIETHRLILRPFTESDCKAMYRIQSNPEMTKYTPDEPWKSIEDAYGFLRFAQSLYRDEEVIDGFRYYFAVVEKYSDYVIGYCGLGGPEFDRSLTEVFYSIECDYWGKGYATEVSNALLSYGFTELNLSKIVGFADENNIGSLKVLEKAGLKRKANISGLSEQFSYFNGEAFFEIDKMDYLRLIR